MFDRKIIIVTPWFGRFAGGAELLARGMARELKKRGVGVTVFTTCSASPYDSWWEDHYEPGVYDVEGIETRRFSTVKDPTPYHAAVVKVGRGEKLTAREEQDFFAHGINSDALVDALAAYVDGEYEVVALPYFHGLVHSAVNSYPGRISLAPCFHDEPQFYWGATETLLRNAHHVFFNSHEEKLMTIKRYGPKVGRALVESVVAGVGVELAACDDEQEGGPAHKLPDNYFVYAGRKEEGKNVRVLCQWFAGYAERFRRDTKLVFIGGGDASLIPPAENFVDFGFVPEATKQRLIRNSKGVINLSENESFSIVIMEGWLLGVPAVVSSRCAVTAGHVRRCDGGLHVADGEEFALALKYLEDDDAARGALAANGRRYVAREFSFDAVLSRYLREFRQGRRPRQLYDATAA
ncbi:MAG TPA: glycosyltransferase family 4 protein [Pyrinomonadaceae bacterium]|nr:glycosyltransferase family 4 protein [Pyrinomonadaceae bacterium]